MENSLKMLLMYEKSKLQDTVTAVCNAAVTALAKTGMENCSFAAASQYDISIFITFTSFHQKMLTFYSSLKWEEIMEFQHLPTKWNCYFLNSSNQLPRHLKIKSYFHPLWVYAGIQIHFSEWEIFEIIHFRELCNISLVLIPSTIMRVNLAVHCYSSVLRCIECISQVLSSCQQSTQHQQTLPGSICDHRF